MHLFRSLLYVPADNERRIEKALNSGADVAILDLEDSVAVGRKEAARNKLKSHLARPRTAIAYVRVNAMSTPFCLEDIHAAMESGAGGISLPMVESPEDVFAVDWVMSQLEKKLALEAGSVGLLPVIETARGLQFAAQALARVKRVRRAGLGVGDLALEMNLELSADQREILPYRHSLVLASSVAGLEAPLDTVYLDLDNLEGLRESCIQSRRIGFQGRRIIHPSHIAIVNEAYAPTDAEVRLAEKIVAEFGEAERNGIAAVRVGASVVDYPVARRAQAVLARRDAIRQAEAKPKAVFTQ